MFDKYKFGTAIWLFDEAGDGDGAAGGGGEVHAADGANDAGVDKGDGADQGKDGGVAELYRPEGLPDHWAGTTDKETIDKLYKVADGFRKDLSKSKNVPEKLDDYKIELPDDVAKTVFKAGEDGKDPVFEHMRGVFHKHGIAPAAALEVIKEFSGQITAAAASQSGEDNGDFEYKSLGGAEKAKPIVEAQQTFINGLKQSGKISDKLAGELELMTYHSEGLEALNELRGLMGGKPIPVDFKAGNDTGKITQAALNSRVADPRYHKGSKEFSQEFFDETTRMFKEFYNNEKAA